MYIAILFCAVWLGVCSCDTQDYREPCLYKVQLRYDYNEENGTSENMIEYWVSHIDEYIFDDQNILFLTRRVTPDRCADYMNSEFDLPPGTYSVIAVGNADSRSAVQDEATGNAPLAGKTHREDMRLSLDNADEFEDGTKGPCEELFHGYRTFTVREVGASRVRVDMVNAHFQLRFRVTWRNNPAPTRGAYYSVLDDIPSEYHLMPQYIYPAGSFSIENHDHEYHDLYPYEDNRVIHHIPHTNHQQRNVLTHSNTTYLNADNEVWGTFVNYRIKTATKPILRLYYAGETRGDGDDRMVLPRDIDLQAFFRWYNYELDHELKQEYVLDILVDGDTIIISPLDNLNVADWTEGGVLGM